MTEPTGPRFYRTILTVEVLGNEPFTGDLGTLSHAVIEGGHSGTVLAEATEEIDRAAAAALLTLHGSDPGFLSAD